MRATIDGIEVDCELSNRLNLKSTVTRHAIEEGGATNDHIETLPAEFTLEVFFTNTPLVSESEAAKRGVTKDSSSLGARGALGFWQEQLEALRFIWLTKKLIKVVTELGVFQDVVIQSMSPTQTPDIADAIMISISFVELRILESQTTRIINKKPINPKTATSKKDQNTKPMIPVPDAQQNEINSSWLKGDFDFAGITTAGDGLR